MHFREFLKKFSENFGNSHKNSQQFLVFAQTRQKLTHGLLNFFEKSAKITRTPQKFI